MRERERESVRVREGKCAGERGSVRVREREIVRMRERVCG